MPAAQLFPPFTTWTATEGSSFYIPCVFVVPVDLVACSSSAPRAIDSANPVTGASSVSEIAGGPLAYGQSGAILFAVWNGLLGLSASTKTPVRVVVSYTGIPFTVGEGIGSCSRTDVFDSTIVGSSIGVSTQD